MFKKTLYILFLLFLTQKTIANSNDLTSGFVVIDATCVCIIPNSIKVFNISEIKIKNLETGNMCKVDSLTFTTNKKITVSKLPIPIDKKPKTKVAVHSPSRVSIPFSQLPFQEGGGLGLFFGISFGVTTIIIKELKKLNNNYFATSVFEIDTVCIKKKSLLISYQNVYQSIAFNNFLFIRPPPFFYKQEKTIVAS